jgi:hypothetical protein
MEFIELWSVIALKGGGMLSLYGRMAEILAKDGFW